MVFLKIILLNNYSTQKLVARHCLFYRFNYFNPSIMMLISQSTTALEQTAASGSTPSDDFVRLLVSAVALKKGAKESQDSEG